MLFDIENNLNNFILMHSSHNVDKLFYTMIIYDMHNQISTSGKGYDAINYRAESSLMMPDREKIATLKPNILDYSNRAHGACNQAIFSHYTTTKPHNVCSKSLGRKRSPYIHRRAPGGIQAANFSAKYYSLSRPTRVLFIAR